METSKELICTNAQFQLAMENELVDKARTYAINNHKNTNHLYDGLPYSVHLSMVFRYAIKYQHLLPEEARPYALAAAWAHDVIEDTRQTYNDVKAELGERVADIVFALTNDKGKTRKERAGEKYYMGIRQIELAVYAKICDRLGNTKYSSDLMSAMLYKYRKEYPEFEKELCVDYLPFAAVMFAELKQLTFRINHE